MTLYMKFCKYSVNCYCFMNDFYFVCVSIVMHVMKTYSSLEDLLADVMGVSILTVTSPPEQQSQGQASATASMIVQTAAGEEDIAVFLKMRRAGTRAEEWDRAFGLYRYRVFGLQYRVFSSIRVMKQHVTNPAHCSKIL